MKLKKAAVLLLTAAMVVTNFAGCGSKTTTTTGESGNTASSGTNAGVSDAERPTVTIMVDDYEGSPLTGDYAEEVIQKMEDYTNTNVEFTWVADDSYEEKLSLTLASPDDMPMIISVGKMTAAIVGAAEAGAFWNLSDYMFDAEKYPNLSQANEQVCNSLKVDGQLVGIYKARPIGRNGVGYRADWAEKLGISEPKTFEDIYNMAYAFTYNDPDGNGKDDTYGIALCKYTGVFDIIQTWFGCGNGWVEKDGQLVPVFQTDEYMEALKWIKKMYDDGLVYQDWAVRDTATWRDAVKNGECGMFVDVLDGSRSIWDYFVTNNIPSVTDSGKTASMNLVGAINGHTLATSGYNGFFVITKAADTEEKLAACLHYLDKMNDNEMLVLSGYGLEGVNYNITADGKIEDTDVGVDTLVKNYGALNQTVAYIPNLSPTSPALALTERQEIENKVKADNEQYAVFNPALGYLNNSDTYSLSGATLDKIIDDARTQYICGQIDEAGLKAAWDNWLAQGGSDVIKEVNEQYSADKSAGK